MIQLCILVFNVYYVIWYFTDSAREDSRVVPPPDLHTDGPQAPSGGGPQRPTPLSGPHHSGEWRCPVCQTGGSAQDSPDEPEVCDLRCYNYTERVQSVCHDSWAWYVFWLKRNNLDCRNFGNLVEKLKWTILKALINHKIKLLWIKVDFSIWDKKIIQMIFSVHLLLDKIINMAVWYCYIYVVVFKSFLWLIHRTAITFPVRNEGSDDEWISWFPLPNKQHFLCWQNRS